jgi:ATP-dependent RNA helicase RhlE
LASVSNKSNKLLTKRIFFMSYQYRTSRSPYAASRSGRGRTSQRSAGRKNQGVYIDPSRFVKVATIGSQAEEVPQYKFSDFDMHQLLHANLTTKGYSIPSPIQDQTIPIALEGKDVIGIASTGTGKTAAFALPVLQRLITDRNTSALIIAPTRELAQQIEQECRELARGSGLFGTLLIGGTNMSGQLRDLRQNPRIVIGTPGRIKDHLTRGSLNLRQFNTVVLDEVDRMLDMGFVHDVTEILSHMAENRQSFFFSATIDSRVRNLIDRFTDSPVTVSLKASSTSENVHQDIIRYQGNSDKMDKLHELLSKQEVAKAIVFDETQRGVERLSNVLIDRGFSADAIHGGKSQGQRQRALARFKKSDVRILVATDVAARGIDVVDITHVINFSTPKAYDDYIHRIGRAGRAGQVGYALTFVPH